MASDVSEKLESDPGDGLFAFVTPFVAYLLLVGVASQEFLGRYYPWTYAAAIALVTGLLWLYRAPYPAFRADGLWIGIVAGVAGIFLWIGATELLRDSWIAENIPLGSRAGYDPYSQIESDIGRVVFLGARLFGLAIVVPLVEEIFWRGFLLRWLVAEEFETVPMGTFGWPSFAIVTVGFAAAHTSEELLASLAWGAAINGVLYWTRNLWACIAMHAVTNFLLWTYVVGFGAWEYW